MQYMHIVNVSASELKNNVSNVLNDVYFNKKTAVIKRYGEIIAKIVPVDKESKSTRSILNKYFGALPDFPDISKERTFRKRDIGL
ncbi:hypothetical protein A2690_02270 [Candidatus Roizmanbacteria bacterium RIFCSPHIGHO2_01_FULL_39_12b]|uniref:Antitoxin n=1 Tax=Candidatus Roizmanbacteria bacterium RIFCSPHIGHO2_01_FULL_39_12b TaxID=1802030 RepID=A0A1F7G821_9BACT|nr:MAG: hypothetical protein A2690_02270 [Candidatus Roizmanbacteria bacterium RIFCSPHIGHO2_01_FULL_39_12b]